MAAPKGQFKDVCGLAAPGRVWNAELAPVFGTQIHPRTGRQVCLRIVDSSAHSELLLYFSRRWGLLRGPECQTDMRDILDHGFEFRESHRIGMIRAGT